MILLEKFDITYGKNELLNNWTTIFNTIDELLEFLKENKHYILGNDNLKFKLIIRDVKNKEGD